MTRATTVYLGEDTIEEIDTRRPSTKSRSQWVKEACKGRLQAEDAGEWSDPDAEPTEEETTAEV